MPRPGREATSLRGLATNTVKKLFKIRDFVPGMSILLISFSKCSENRHKEVQKNVLALMCTDMYYFIFFEKIYF